MANFAKLRAMFRLSRKFVAVLMLLWLPLSGGSALAATVSMQAQSDACHEMSTQEMHHQDAGEHQHHPAEAPAAHDQSDSSCNTCGICHLACSSYLAVPAIDATEAQAPANWVTPYLLSFHSITSTPIVPPPLARV